MILYYYSTNLRGFDYKDKHKDNYNDNDDLFNSWNAGVLQYIEDSAASRTGRKRRHTCHLMHSPFFIGQAEKLSLKVHRSWVIRI